MITPRFLRGWPGGDLVILLAWIFAAIGILILIAWGLKQLFGE